jgi:DOPA 4,5-dioxygenase
MSSAPFHAHVYYAADQRPAALALRERFAAMPEVLFAGDLRDAPVGPHPTPQFEIHFAEDALPVLTPILEGSGLRVLVHPLTDDDLADHTTLGRWIGAPLDLDVSVLDPPGENQGIPRFGKTDF